MKSQRVHSTQTKLFLWKFQIGAYFLIRSMRRGRHILCSAWTGSHRIVDAHSGYVFVVEDWKEMNRKVVLHPRTLPYPAQNTEHAVLDELILQTEYFGEGTQLGERIWDMCVKYGSYEMHQTGRMRWRGGNGLGTTWTVTRRHPWNGNWLSTYRQRAKSKVANFEFIFEMMFEIITWGAVSPKIHVDYGVSYFISDNSLLCHTVLSKLPVSSVRITVNGTVCVWLLFTSSVVSQNLQLAYAGRFGTPCKLT